MKVKVISLPCIFQVLYVLCFAWPRYQVSVYRTIGPLASNALPMNISQLKILYINYREYKAAGFGLAIILLLTRYKLPKNKISFIEQFLKDHFFSTALEDLQSIRPVVQKFRFS